MKGVLTGGMKSFTRLTCKNTVFMECDIQQKLGKFIQKNDTVVHNAKRLTQVSQITSIPVIATCHVKKNFGDIDAIITEVTHPGRTVFDKSLFSMIEPPVEAYLDKLKDKHVDQVVLYGVEAHVCVKQTCLDLLERGYGVHLVIDAISSMNQHDRNVGIESMKMAGA